MIIQKAIKIIRDSAWNPNNHYSAQYRAGLLNAVAIIEFHFNHYINDSGTENKQVTENKQETSCEFETFEQWREYTKYDNRGVFSVDTNMRLAWEAAQQARDQVLLDIRNDLHDLAVLLGV